MQKLPELHYENLLPSRNYLQNICLVMGAVQRAFLPPNEHEWQHGLKVNSRGIMTQEFIAGDQPIRLSLDLVAHKLRLGETNWLLEDYAAPELLKNIKVWFQSRGIEMVLEEPEFISGKSVFSIEQAEAFSNALWWFERQFSAIKSSRIDGLTSPVLLYPHHFDLAMTWFPYDDERQLSIGFSTGDEAVTEPYVYLTAYPEPAAFHETGLNGGAYWQTKDFRGAVLPYSALQSTSDSAAVLQSFAKGLFDRGSQLLAG